ncbi:paxillin-like isoform X2 [Varroa jacobsoni]|uniref:LIM zinc-binding domain-containing protein n=1 Tax=Varroa destructor TaxID=109461 RepID=A0A7M7K4Z4_VARDE|nr:paxillin-like isoform X2 [Varroa destructor]XP_022705862.1 paxillin-like isoform X2 [Varroa jacobsoni]
MENLDNLLADLQSSRRDYEVSYKRSGSMERRETSPRTTTSSSVVDRPVTPVQIVPETATKDLQYTYQMHDPIYQNSHVIKETITAHDNRSTSAGSRPSSRPRTPTNPHGSSATQELDSLMASLSEFRLRDPYYSSSHYHQPQRKEARTLVTPTSSHSTHSTPRPRDSALDSMLGSLREDMNNQGVNAGAGKGCCAACKKPIVGQVVTALGRMWHPEHFVCSHCNQELGTRNFYERDGEPYCEQDYHNIFSPRCSYCNGPILDKCVTALDRTWHPEHFFCAQCGRQFGEEGFHEKDGKPYCREDYFAMFAPKCAGCSMPITENYISALSMQWHPECFVCRDCLQPFQGGSFYDYEGQPYCETHYHAKRGSLCAGCHKPISGRCITAMFRKYHPEHFVCSFCLKQLNKGTFKEENDKPYCHDCFEKLYS